MPIGTVKSWNDLRGFGFMQPDGDGPDQFVHAKNLDGCSELVRHRGTFGGRMNRIGVSRKSPHPALPGGGPSIYESREMLVV
jgi:'Cold-shock' DNA-binding domain